MKREIRVLRGSTAREIKKRNEFFRLFKSNPLPETEQLQNLGLFLNRQALSRILFIRKLYKKILNVHGVIIEFGVRWGQNLALFQSLRGIYEPYNYNRRIIGFDTFSGFSQTNEKDGSLLAAGDYSVTDQYQAYLHKVLRYHESESPIPHKRKFELIAGDAGQTIETYLSDHPETIIALAYFDFDLYSPTEKCLRAVRDHITKGSVLAFDELNTPEFPGETLAVKEVLGLDRYAIRRSPLAPTCSFIVVD